MTIVVKLGGRVQSDTGLARALHELWNANPGALCIVHGGGDEVSALQRKLGREPEFVNGRRVTTDDDVELVRMVLSGSANKRLVALLIAAGLPAAGISGEDGGILPATPIDDRLGRAGKPLVPEVGLIRALLAAGFLPVISPVATDSTSVLRAPLNVNGDDAAAAIAAALGADLWMIADVEGVLDDDKVPVHRLAASQLPPLVAAGTVNKGMHAKLEAGFAALEAGSPAVRVTSLQGLSMPGAGTFLSLG